MIAQARCLPQDHWYAAQLKPGGFARASTNLDRQAFTTFMPLCEVPIRRNGRLFVTLRPLFAGYIFVHIDPGQQHWGAINNTFGVSRLVALDGIRPTPVPDGLVAALADRCDAAGQWLPAADLHVGDRVRITQGPFAGAIGDIAALPEQGRVCLLLEMMGRSIRTAVAARAVEQA